MTYEDAVARRDVSGLRFFFLGGGFKVKRTGGKGYLKSRVHHGAFALLCLPCGGIPASRVRGVQILVLFVLNTC